MIDPRDTVDIPDDREPEHNIPDAVCDVQTVQWDELFDRVGRWLTERSRVSHLESLGLARSDDWHDVEDDATSILETLATRLKIFPIIDPGTVVETQDGESHIGVVIEPFMQSDLPGWILVDWTHIGICDEAVGDVTVLGDSLPAPSAEDAPTVDECGVDGALRDM